MSQELKPEIERLMIENLDALKQCRERIAQLERTNAALLGALKQMVDDAGKSDYQVRRKAYAAARAAIAEAETTGGPNHEAHP